MTALLQRFLHRIWDAFPGKELSGGVEAAAALAEAVVEAGLQWRIWMTMRTQPGRTTPLTRNHWRAPSLPTALAATAAAAAAAAAAVLPLAAAA
eukprot:6195675-Pleurochrysis_carterae.AAC.1